MTAEKKETQAEHFAKMQLETLQNRHRLDALVRELLAEGVSPDAVGCMFISAGYALLENEGGPVGLLKVMSQVLKNSGVLERAREAMEGEDDGMDVSVEATLSRVDASGAQTVFESEGHARAAAAGILDDSDVVEKMGSVPMRIYTCDKSNMLTPVTSPDAVRRSDFKFLQAALRAVIKDGNADPHSFGAGVLVIFDDSEERRLYLEDRNELVMARVVHCADCDALHMDVVPEDERVKFEVQKVGAVPTMH